MTTKPVYDLRISRKETQAHGLTAFRYLQRYYPLKAPYAADSTLNHIIGGELLYELDEGEENTIPGVVQLQSVVTGRDIIHYTQVKKVYGIATFGNETTQVDRYRSGDGPGDAQVPQLSAANIAKFLPHINVAAGTVLKVGDRVWWCIPRPSIERETLYLDNKFVPSNRCPAHEHLHDHDIHEYNYRFYGYVASTDAYSFEIALIRSCPVEGRFRLPSFKNHEPFEWIRKFYDRSSMSPVGRLDEGFNMFSYTWFAGLRGRDFGRDPNFRGRFLSNSRDLNSVLRAWYERIDAYRQYQGNNNTYKIVDVNEEDNLVQLNVLLTCSYIGRIARENVDALQRNVLTVNRDFLQFVVALQEYEVLIQDTRVVVNHVFVPALLDPDEAGIVIEDIPPFFAGVHSPAFERYAENMVRVDRNIVSCITGIIGPGEFCNTIHEDIDYMLADFAQLLRTFRGQVRVADFLPQDEADVDEQIRIMEELLVRVDQLRARILNDIEPIAQEMDALCFLPDRTPGGDFLVAYGECFDAYNRIVQDPNDIPRYRVYAAAMRRWKPLRDEFLDLALDYIQIVGEMYTDMDDGWNTISLRMRQALTFFGRLLGVVVDPGVQLGNIAPLVDVAVNMIDQFPDLAGLDLVGAARADHDQLGYSVLRIIGLISQYTAIKFPSMDLVVRIVKMPFDGDVDVDEIANGLEHVEIVMTEVPCNHVIVEVPPDNRQNEMCVMTLTFLNSQTQNRLLF